MLLLLLVIYNIIITILFIVTLIISILKCNEIEDYLKDVNVELVNSRKK